jgi:hypothetical protein
VYEGRKEVWKIRDVKGEERRIGSYNKRFGKSLISSRKKMYRKLEKRFGKSSTLRKILLL